MKAKLYDSARSSDVCRILYSIVLGNDVCRVTNHRLLV